MLADETRTNSFSEFVSEYERRIRQALTAAFGPELGSEATAEALAYGWSNVQLRHVDEEEEILWFGDGYQTTEGCGDDPTAMQDAFDKYGPPKTACLHIVTLDDGDAEYRGPLEDLRW